MPVIILSHMRLIINLIFLFSCLTVVNKSAVAFSWWCAAAAVILNCVSCSAQYFLASYEETRNDLRKSNYVDDFSSKKL